MPCVKMSDWWLDSVLILVRICAHLWRPDCHTITQPTPAQPSPAQMVIVINILSNSTNHEVTASPRARQRSSPDIFIGINLKMCPE